MKETRRIGGFCGTDVSVFGNVGESLILLFVRFAGLLSLSVFVVRWGVGAPAPPVTSVDPLLFSELARGSNVSILTSLV